MSTITRHNAGPAIQAIILTIVHIKTVIYSVLMNIANSVNCHLCMHVRNVKMVIILSKWMAEELVWKFNQSCLDVTSSVSINPIAINATNSTIKIQPLELVNLKPNLAHKCVHIVPNLKTEYFIANANNKGILFSLLNKFVSKIRWQKIPIVQQFRHFLGHPIVSNVKIKWLSVLII